jgi:hypothetical protein
LSHDPTAIEPFTLRLRNELRYKIAVSAKEGGLSQNSEIVRRLDASFAAEAAADIWAAAEAIKSAWTKLVRAENLHALGDRLAVAYDAQTARAWQEERRTVEQFRLLSDAPFSGGCITGELNPSPPPVSPSPATMPPTSSAPSADHVSSFDEFML